MADAQQLAGILALTIKSEIAPLRERLTMYAERDVAREAEIVALRADVGQLRERVAAAEARPPVPGPKGRSRHARRRRLHARRDHRRRRTPTMRACCTLGYRRGELAKGIGTVRLPVPAYCGVYDRERAYLPGDQVTHAGALWHCHAPTRSKPGDGRDGWQLQVKRGQG